MKVLAAPSILWRRSLSKFAPISDQQKKELLDTVLCTFGAIESSLNNLEPYKEVTDLCGLLIYSGNFLIGESGKDGAKYQKRSRTIYKFKIG